MKALAIAAAVYLFFYVWCLLAIRRKEKRPRIKAWLRNEKVVEMPYEAEYVNKIRRVK